MFGMKRSDAHLVGQVLRGNKDHYAPLVERYLPAVRSVARANAGPWADADDIAQETFVDAYRTLDKLRERNKFAHWLLRIARNKARDWADADRRERQKREAAGASIPASSSEPTHEEREIHALLHAELEAMPPEQREVLALFHLAGHGTREIAGMLDLSHDAVRKRLQRGREALGERMLRRMEQPQNQEECGKRAKAISGIAIGAAVAWEASATTGGWAAAAGWGMGGNIAAGAAIGVVAAGVFLMGDEPTDVTVAENVSQAAGTWPYIDSERVEEEVVADNAEGVEHVASEVTPPVPLGNGVVFGTVYGLDDMPLSDTTVHLVFRAEDISPARAQQSDGEGNFRFQGLPEDGGFFTLWSVTPDSRSAATEWNVFMEGHRFNQQFLEMKPALPISGRVLDSEGRPIRDAKVRPSGYKAGDTIKPETLMPAVVTDSDGAYRIAYLKAGEWNFEVTAAGHAAGLLGPVRAGADAGSVVLLPGNTLAGSVADAETGEPVVDIQVWLSIEGKGPEMYRTLKTDDHGQFQFDDLREASYQVAIYGDWFAEPSRVALTQGETTPQIDIVAERGAMVRGRVTDSAGTGVAGIDIVAAVAGRMDAKASTDVNGYYTLTGLLPGDTTVRTKVQSAEGAVAVTLAMMELKEGVDFTLIVGERSASGRAVDAAGSPIAGVRVEAFGQVENSVPQICVSDAEGNFQFTGLVSSRNFFWIRGHKDGWISRDLRLGLDKSDLENLRLVMELPAGLTGRLLDSAGRPMSGKMLALDGVDVNPYSSRSARTTERGRFAFPNKVPGTYRLMDTPENGSRRAIGEVTLAAGEVKTDLQMTLVSGDAPMKISGRVIDEKGEPALLATAWLMRGSSQTGGYCLTQADGKFEFSVEDPGSYTVQLVKTGYIAVMLEDVRAGAVDLEAVLLPAARVEGRALAANGAPLEHYKIKWHTGERNDLADMGPIEAQTVVDPEGRFGMANVDTGVVTIAAWAEGYAPTFATLELASGEVHSGVEFRLEAAQPESPEVPEVAQATTSLQGIVLNARREPVVGAYIYLNHRPHPTDRSGPARATSGPDGRFVINEVSLGTSRVLAWHKDYAPAGAALSLSDKAVHETTITMAAGGTLEGSLTGSGTALRDAYLSIDSNVLEERFYENVYPGAKGFFSARHVAAGSTTINVHYKDRWYKFPANVVEGGTSRTDIDLQVGTSAIDGTLMIDGEPVEGEITVVLPVLGGDRERFTFNTTRSGRFFIDELPAGPVELEALCEDGGTVRQTIELVAGEDLEFAMEVQRADPVP